MSDGYQAGELERLIANMLRLGTIADLDEGHEDGARVTVDIGDMVTDWLPFFSRRAGPDADWAPPEPGEQVMILSPYGDMTQGVVLPAIYQDAHPQPASARTVRRTTYADGTVEQHDRDAKAYSYIVPAGGRITLAVGSTSLVLEDGKATLNADVLEHVGTQATFEGMATVKKLLSWLSGVAGSKGTSGGTNAIDGGVNVVNGDVVVDGIGVKSHHHTAQGATAPTTAAQA